MAGMCRHVVRAEAGGRSLFSAFEGCRYDYENFVVRSSVISRHPRGYIFFLFVKSTEKAFDAWCEKIEVCSQRGEKSLGNILEFIIFL